MAGKATIWEGDSVVASLKNEQVLKHWRLVPLDLELKIRRLKWYQAICADPQAHAQLIVALFGQPRMRPMPQCDEQGYPTAEAGPYLLRMWEDLLEVRKHEQLEEVALGISSGLAPLFRDEGIKKLL